MDRRKKTWGVVLLLYTILVCGCVQRGEVRQDPAVAQILPVAAAPAVIHLPVAEMNITEEIIVCAPGAAPESRQKNSQTIFISYPTPAPRVFAAQTAACADYTVQAGDDLRTIAAACYGDERYWRLLYEVNQDVVADPDRIVPGQRIKVPQR